MRKGLTLLILSLVVTACARGGSASPAASEAADDPVGAYLVAHRIPGMDAHLTARILGPRRR
jgi:hypothetical protein